jgi:hypothetical protein
MKVLEEYKILNWNNAKRLRLTIPRRPSVSRRFSAGHKEGSQVEGKGVNALIKYLAGVHNPVVNDRGTECVSLRPSVPRWPSVPRRFSAGHKVGSQVEGKGVNALIKYLAGVHNPVVNDRGMECVTLRPAVPRRHSVSWWHSVSRRFSAGLTDDVRPEGKGVNALTVCTAAEGRHPVVNDRGTECTAAGCGVPVVNDRGAERVSLRPTVPQRLCLSWWPSVTRRFSAGHTDNSQTEGKGVNALTEFLAEVCNPVVNDRGTEHAAPDRPHQNERTWPSVNWRTSVTRRPSVTRCFSAGHKVGSQVEGKGVNALTEFLAWVNSPVVNDRGTECVSLRPSVPRWPSVPRRFSAGHKVGSQVEGKGVNALTEFLAWVNSPVVNDRGTECLALGCGVSVVNERGTEHATPDRPHQNERSLSSVTRRPSLPRRNSVTRRFSAGHKEESQSEGKGVNALTEFLAEVRNPVVNDRGTECVSLRPSVPRWPSVTRRFSAGHKVGSQVEGKGVNALIKYLAGVHNPVVNDRGTEHTAAGGRVSVVNERGAEHATPDRPHQNERSLSSVNWRPSATWRPSVTRRFSAGHKVGSQVEGKGVNALTENVAGVRNPVVNDRGTECVTLRPAVPRRHSVSWWHSVSRRFSAGHKEGSQVEGKGVNALIENVAGVRNPVVNDRDTECTAADGSHSVMNDRGTECAAAGVGDLDYHTPSYFGNMLDLRAPALQRRA